MINNQSHSPFMMSCIEFHEKKDLLLFYFSLFNIHEWAEIWGTENLVAASSEIFPLSCPSMKTPPSTLFSSIQTPRHTAHWRSVLVCWADCITFWHTHILPGPFSPESIWGRPARHGHSCVCIWAIIWNTTAVSLITDLKMNRVHHPQIIMKTPDVLSSILAVGP